jgi:hypothetical protein
MQLTWTSATKPNSPTSFHLASSVVSSTYQEPDVVAATMETLDRGGIGDVTTVGSIIFAAEAAGMDKKNTSLALDHGRDGATSSSCFREVTLTPR